MDQNIQSLFLTSLTTPQLRNLFRDEIENYFKHNPVNKITQNEDNEIILNIEQASQYIKLSIPSIYRLTGTNELPFIRRGKKLLFSQKDLTAWLMQGRNKTLGEIQKDSQRLHPISQ